MPSPVGHALGGALVGILSAPSTDAMRVSDTTRFVVTCAVVACLPDLDFLWGRHNMETHSVGAALMAGLVTLALTRGRDARPASAFRLRRRRLATAVTLAWGSHVLFDWLGSDTTPPLGVMALWPLSSEYYFANAFIFEAILRRYRLEGFWRHNLLAVVSEVLLLGPPVIVLRWWNARRAGRGEAKASPLRT